MPRDLGDDASSRINNSEEQLSAEQRQVEATERLIQRIDQLLSGTMKTEIVGDRTKRQASQQPPSTSSIQSWQVGPTSSQQSW